MKHLSTSFLSYARRGALLLALGAAGPAAWGQSFGPVNTYLVGQPNCVVLADVNKDGRIDIVTSQSGGPGTTSYGAVYVLLGQANGFAPSLRYSAGPVYSTGNATQNVAVGDINGDGWPDIILTEILGSNQVKMFLGSATGFGPIILNAFSTGVPGSKEIEAGDINGDGFADVVYLQNDSRPIVAVLGRASGLGVVGSGSSTTVGGGGSSFPRGIVLGDVNGDGRLDIVSSNNDPTVGVRLYDTSYAYMEFGSQTVYPVGTTTIPGGLALGDVNGDGRLDIVVGNNDSSSSVGVFLGQSSGFAPVSRYATNGDVSSSVALGDVNGDGRQDIITANYGSNTISVLLGQATGFAPAITFPSIPGTPTKALRKGIGVKDMNGDNRPDIVVATDYNNSVGVLLNTGTFTPLATAHTTTGADIALYPNPAHASFTVQLPAAFGPVRAELLNALGQVVRSSAAASPSFSVDTDGLAPGIYTLRLASGAVARRVVVE